MEIIGEGKPQVSWDGGTIPVVMFRLFRNSKWDACIGLALSNSRPRMYNRNFFGGRQGSAFLHSLEDV